MSQNSLMSNKYDKIQRTNLMPTSSIPRSSQSELKKRFIDRSDNLVNMYVIFYIVFLLITKAVIKKNS